MSFYRQNGDIKIKKQRQINDGIIKIVIMGWLIVIGTFFGKILLKLGFGQLICLFLRMAWLEKIIERCFEKKGRTVIMIAELEKKFETQEKYYQDLKKENKKLRLDNKEFEKKLDTIIKAVVVKKNKE